jgi:nucleoside 2-deoxyribosyltransferase
MEEYDSTCYELGYWMAREIPPRLRAMATHATTIPPDMTTADWKGILRRMADLISVSDLGGSAYEASRKEACEMLAKYWPYLWD